MVTPTDRRVSSRDPGRSSRDRSSRTRGPRWPVAASYQSRSALRWSSDGRVELAHPVVGVRARHPVLGVPCGSRGAQADRRASSRGHLLPPRWCWQVSRWSSAPTTPAPTAPTAQADDPVTFTVALIDEVDSLQPVPRLSRRTSYEMWALAYDYLVGYSMTDMSPAPALATEWETSGDGLTWTFTSARACSGPTASRSPRPTSPTPTTACSTGGIEASNWVDLPQQRRDRHRARRHHRRADAAASPTRCCRCCRSRSCPSTCGRTSTEGGQELRQRAERRAAGRRLRAVPAGRGHGRRVDVPLRGEPRLLGRRAARRPGRLPRLQERTTRPSRR